MTRQLQVGIFGDNHARRMYRVHSIDQPAFSYGITPHHVSQEQQYITHLLYATHATPFYQPPQLHALPHINIFQAMAYHRDADAILITGGGNDLDTHICIPEAIACAIEKLVMLVYTTYGRPCYFIPFLHRLTFHSTIFDKNEHDITLQTTTHNHEPSHNLSSLPYNPILSVRSTLVLEVDGVHL